MVGPRLREHNIFHHRRLSENTLFPGVVVHTAQRAGLEAVGISSRPRVEVLPPIHPLLQQHKCTHLSGVCYKHIILPLR